MNIFVSFGNQYFAARLKPGHQEKVKSPKPEMNKPSKIVPWIAFGLISLICYIAFKDFLLLGKAYFFYDITSDGYYLSYPFFHNNAEYIAQHGIPKWSFKMGMGQSLFPFVLRDPPEILLYIVGAKHILGAAIYSEVITIICAGITFFFYLRELKLSDYTCVVGCLFFSFCSYIIEGSPWFGFSFEAFNFALFLLAFEQLFNRGKLILFPVAVFLTCISMPFNLYLFGLCIFLYTIFRLFQDGTFKITKLGELFLKMLALSVIGILLAGPFLLENIMLLIESPRGSETSTLSHQLSSSPVFALIDKFQLGTGVMRLFSNDMIGSGSNFKGWDTILGAPMFYCGLPCLLLVPQVFQFLSKRKRVVFTLFLAIWLLPMAFPYFRRAFWLFTGDYYRAYSFFVTVVIMYYSVFALDFIIRQRKVNVPILLTTLLLWVALLFYPFFPNKDTVDFTIRIFTIVVLCLYTLILIGVNKTPNFNFVKFAFFIVLFYELCYTTGITGNRRDAYAMGALKDKFQYNNYFLDAVQYIQYHDSSFIRIDKSFEPASARYSDLNYGLAEGYNSTSSYFPFNQLYYVRFLQTMGVAEKNNEQDSRWAKGLLDNPILECENRVKYFMTRRDSVPLSKVMWDSVTKTGDVKIFRNKFVLPFGFTYTHFIRESQFDSMSKRQKEFISLKAFVIRDSNTYKLPGLAAYNLTDTSNIYPDSSILRNDVNELSRDTLVINEFTDNSLSGRINTTRTELMYLSIPYDKGWHLKVDGKEVEKIIVDGGMTGVFLAPGAHSIEMNYKIRYWNIGLILSLSGILLSFCMWFYVRNGNKKQSA